MTREEIERLELRLKRGGMMLSKEAADLCKLSLSLLERIDALGKAIVSDDNELELAWAAALNLPRDAEGYCTEEGTSGHSLAMRGVAAYRALLIAAEACQKRREEAERKLAEIRRDLLPLLNEIIDGKESFVMVDGRGLPVAKATAVRLKAVLEAAEGR